MKVELQVTKEFEVKYLQAKCGVRYFEDATVNGVDDEEGDLMPCMDGMDNWCPLIDIETGQILNWEIGKESSVHYKTVDDNEFTLLDPEKNKVTSIDGYVISTMRPSGDGDNDYVVMDIDKEGFIQNWYFDLSDFVKED